MAVITYKLKHEDSVILGYARKEISDYFEGLENWESITPDDERNPDKCGYIISGTG